VAHRFMVLWVVLGVVVPLTSAQAAIWAWGCQGQLGEQQVIFNRNSMVIVDTKVKMGDVRKLRTDKIELPPGAPPSVSYEPADYNNGFEEKTMEFTRSDDAQLKLTLTQKSSKRISHKHRQAMCGREEDTDVYRKTFSLQRENAAPRDITMQCMEYQLSTRGGRKCD
jgi:hypothetical protein